MRQIPFDLPLPARLGRDDYLVTAANRAVFDTVTAWPRWPDRVLLLVGPEGSGKTHLATIWAEQAGAAVTPAAGPTRLPAADAGAHHLVVDDADRTGGDEAWLFHTLNSLREHGRSALLTARTAPDLWGLRTPDLLSRLRLAPMLQPHLPDDALVGAVLVKLFADRQLTVDATMVDYLTRRMERSIAAARVLVAALDRESLAAGRRITRGVAAGVLEALEAGAASGHGVVTTLGDKATDP